MCLSVATDSVKKIEELTPEDGVLSGEEAIAQPTEATAAKIIEMSLEERAARLGFAQFLPKDTAVLMTAYDARGAYEDLKALDLYQILEKQMDKGKRQPLDEAFVPADEEMLEDDGDGTDIRIEPEAVAGDEELQEAVPDEDVMEQPTEQSTEEPSEENALELKKETETFDEKAVGPWTLLGREVTIALGNSVSEQSGNLITANRRSSFFQAKLIGQAALAFGKSADKEAFESSMTSMAGFGEIMKELLKDPESGIDLVNKLEMPTLYLAFQANEGELDQAAEMVNSSMAFFGMAGEIAAPIEMEIGAKAFNGYQLVGEKIAETMRMQKESMAEFLSPELADELIDAIGRKNLFVVTGTVGDYVVAMIGGDRDKMTLADSVENSFIASGQLDFTDAFPDQPLLAVSYGEAALGEKVMENSGGLATYALGFREGLASGDGLGDTRELEAMLQIVADREEALQSLGESNDLGTIAYLEGGVKIEAFGGYDNGSSDLRTPRKLAHLGTAADHFVFMNCGSNADYSERMSAYLEAITETLFAAASKLTEVESDAPEIKQIKTYMELLETKYLDDLRGLYRAISGDFSEGLGNEIALVVDLKGAVPAVPGVPQTLVDEGKFPRLTILKPVVDREKLGTAWKSINTHTNSIISEIAEMFEQDIPKQTPMSSESDGMKTWFFPFPFFQDDFLPSVNVSDDWFAASTSKNHAADLMKLANESGEGALGSVIEINFAALSSYADEMMQLIEQNADSLFKTERKLQEFNREKKLAKDLIEAAEEFDLLRIEQRREADYVRTSLHLKVK